MEIHGSVESQYRDFLASCDSPCFAAWTQGVLDDAEVQAWIATLPDGKQQPNLVYAAARWHGVEAPGPYAGLREALLADDAAGGPLRRTVLQRATQTNEVGRMATLLPVLAMLAEQEGRPLALVEAGASAGLCLYPDRWAYRWTTPDGEVVLGEVGESEPMLRCEVAGPAPLPTRLPEVAWRGGVDLNPLDVRDKDAVAWLQTLVWPEHTDRRALLGRGVEVARASPPSLAAGDLLTELPAVVERAAEHGPVVVQHSAVIAYLTDSDRSRFASMMAGLVADGACHWVSNEGPRVVPGLADAAPPPPSGVGRFLLAVDGRPVAWTHGHGRSMTWFG